MTTRKAVQEKGAPFEERDFRNHMEISVQKSVQTILVGQLPLQQAADAIAKQIDAILAKK